jgi:DNA polymerase
MKESPSAAELLRWYLEAGVDETIQNTPVDRYAVAINESRYAVAIDARRYAAAAGPSVSASSPPAAAVPSAATAGPPPQPGSYGSGLAEAATPLSAEAAVHGAVALASAANSVEELRQALLRFDGCALKKTATNLVFTDGSPDALVLFIGEAPGAEEDRQGLPFVGQSGRLLDRMLASIGLDRRRVLISNTVFWRPPGNRTPTTVEMATCMPFLERLIELVDPRVLVTLGGPAAKAVLAESAGVSKLRGRWFSYATPRLSRPIPAMAMFHPAYLLRSPAQKREAWRDLLVLKTKLAGP